MDGIEDSYKYVYVNPRALAQSVIADNEKKIAIVYPTGNYANNLFHLRNLRICRLFILEM